MSTPDFELGPKLHTYGFNYWELLRWFVMIVPILTLISALLPGLDPRTPLVIIVLAIIVFLLVMLYQEIFPGGLTIYEKGIVSRVGKQLRGWRWEQLTTMTGTRRTHYVNGIPLFRYGQNTFVADAIPAFDVTWWTADPNRVVQYIFMKMSERKMSALAQTLDQGGTLSFGSLSMDRTCVRNQKASFLWSDIAGCRWSGKRLAVVSRSQGREITVGSVEPPALYFMMAAMDHLHGTQGYQQYQLNYLQGPARWLGIERRAVLFTVGIIAAVGVLFGGINTVSRFNQWQADRTRNELAVRYGQNSFTLCANAHDERNRGSSTKSDNKYIVVSTDQGININSTFQDGLNKSDVADSKADLTAIICLKSQNVEVESCPYGDSKDKTIFYISRYQKVYLASFVDIQTGKTFASTVLAGEIPGACPESEKASAAKDIYGPLPAPDKLASFLERIKSSPDSDSSA